MYLCEVKIETIHFFITNINTLLYKMIKAIVLSCMDYRFVTKIHNALSQEGYCENYDIFVAAGGSLMYTDDRSVFLLSDDLNNWRNMFEKHIDLALALHDIKEIIIFEHEDCGAYKSFYKNKQSIRSHKYNFKMLQSYLSDQYQSLNIIGYEINLNGEYIKYDE